MKLFDSTVDVLSKSLDMYLVRHSVISDNIANAETPGFKSRKVDFEQQLQKAIDASEAGVEIDASVIQPNVYEDAESELGNDLNTVDMDREMASMTKNDVKYSAASQSIAKKFALLKYAISEGSER